MALLNKLFFPSTNHNNLTSSAAATSTSTSSSTSSSARSSGSAKTNQSKRPNSNNNQSVHSNNYLSQFPFDEQQVRVLLYRECDSRGRRLLFDSNSLQKVYLKENNGNRTVKNVKSSNVRSDDKTSTGSTALLTSAMQNGNKDGSSVQIAGQHEKSAFNNKTHSNGFIEVCEEFGYKHNRPNSADISTMGEMVFGASAMSFRGTALKVHWLNDPSRVSCSEVFLAPLSLGGNNATSGPSPYSTFSMNSLSTPRTSICSEQGSIDGMSMNSFSMPFSVSVDHNRTMSLTPSERVSSPLDVPDQQSIYTLNSDSIRADSAPRYSSTYSTVTDSGYSGNSRGQMSSDQWSGTHSYQYSTRSSLGSVLSEQSDSMRKHSLDSAYFLPPNHRFMEGNSDSSLQRRICRNLRTSFENENSMTDFIGFKSDQHPLGNGNNNGGSDGTAIGRRASYCVNETRSNPEMMNKRRDVAVQRSLARRAKLGLAVCITMSDSFEEEMEQFCSEHIALLESMLSRLRASTERAYIHHKEFLQIMFEAWKETQQWFNDLFTAPRVKCPVWLGITTSGSKYSKNIAERFMSELCWLLSMADTKNTNFFISTMLTAILTHHLGWVSTVSAFNSSNSPALHQRAKLLQVSQKHPYNALWAQMGDLYGAIGMPPKITRTVVYGTEKLSIERLLNILTYFIRCGEVRRSTKREDFNKDKLATWLKENKNQPLKKSAGSGHFSGRLSKKCVKLGSLIRAQTCKQNLNTITDYGNDDEYEYEGMCDEDGLDEYDASDAELVNTLKKNEIPTVLAFRDSRFVQQELRIGNYLMDTGIEKNSLRNKNPTVVLGKEIKDGRIKLTVTTPDNVELQVMEENSSTSGSSSSSTEDGVLEAIEMDSNEVCDASIDCVDALITNNKKNFFWNMVPQSVKDGLSLIDLEKLQHDILINRQLDRRNSSLTTAANDAINDVITLKQKRNSHLSLSDLITQNSMGKGDRMTWGIEPVKEKVSLEEQIHFDSCRKLIERDHDIAPKTAESEKGVFFVLGDNEPLVNLKKSIEDLSTEETQTQPIKALCPLHQQSTAQSEGSQTPVASAKKHSAFKFNFEQYPQIVTNYMRSKNLDMSNYDLLMDKCSKLEAQEAAEQIPTTAGNCMPMPTSCVVCNSLLNAYQTPSNATELDEDETTNPITTRTPTIVTSQTLQSVGSGASLDTLKSVILGNSSDANELTAVNLNSSLVTAEQTLTPISTSSSNNSPPLRKTTYCGNVKKISSHRSSTSSVAAKCAAVNESINLLKLPIPGIKELSQEDESPGDMKLRAGFIPSLFLNVSNHYVSDMVLQGTCAPPNKWETNLREDLALTAHSASLISQSVENIGIVADMENWNVRLISSQTQSFPYGGGQSSPVGMSQLVSSMLETVQVMNSSGISAYECLSFLESKMQEIYLQSETLAAFLLETDFCSLSAVTTALNLAENDVPLLLSVASIHTPQVSKKCGISFR